MAEKKQYSVHLDRELHRRIRVEAAQRGCRISDVIEEVCLEYFRRKKKGKSNGTTQS